MTTSFLKYVSYIPNEVLIKWNLDAKVFNEKAFQAIFWYTWQLFCTFLPPNFWSFCNFGNWPPVDLYLISEKSIWKNQVRRTRFLVYFKLDFYCLCSLQKSILKFIFAGQKSSSSSFIFQTWFFQKSSTNQREV